MRRILPSGGVLCSDSPPLSAPVQSLESIHAPDDGLCNQRSIKLPATAVTRVTVQISDSTHMLVQLLRRLLGVFLGLWRRLNSSDPSFIATIPFPEGLTKMM